MSRSLFRRSRFLFMSVVLVALVTACGDDDPVAPDPPEPPAHCVDYSTYVHWVSGVALPFSVGTKRAVVSGDYIYVINPGGIRVVRGAATGDLVIAGDAAVTG